MFSLNLLKRTLAFLTESRDEWTSVIITNLTKNFYLISISISVSTSVKSIPLAIEIIVCLAFLKMQICKLLQVWSKVCLLLDIGYVIYGVACIHRY